MTVRLSAYHTRATGKVQNDQIISTLGLYRESSLIQKPKGVYALTGSANYETTIASFVFPIIDEKQKCAYIDLRSFYTFNEKTQEGRPRYVEQCEALQLHGSLALSWSQGQHNVNRIQYMSILPMSVFATWLAETITKKMNINGANQYIVMVLAAILYHNNFTDGEGTSESRAALSNTLSNELNYRGMDVNTNLVYNYDWIHSVDDFCTACYEATQSISLKSLNAGVLYSMVGNAIWGANSPEKIGVALEYPPQWITLIYQVITDRSYRGRCALSNIVERRMYDRHKQNFVNQCLMAMEQPF